MLPKGLGNVARALRVLPVVALMAAWLIGSPAANPVAAQEAGTCIDDVTGRTNVCTANDVRISRLRNLSDLECVAGSQVELSLRVDLLSGAHERYDIGLFVARDSGNARIGSCERGYLPPPLSAGGTCSPSGAACNKTSDCPAGETCVGGYDPLSGIGPFFSAEAAGDPGDACGDLEQGVETLYDLGTISVPCLDPDGDGVLDIGTCVAWDSQQTHTCADVNGAVPRTKSKCHCEMVPVGNVIVIPGEVQVTKAAQPGSVAEPGGDVTFTFSILNTSEVAVTLGSLVDTVYGDLTLAPGSTCAVPQPLGPGALYTCSIATLVSGQPGAQLDLVTASGVDANGYPISATAVEEVTIADRLPTMALDKTVTPGALPAPGGTAEYTVRITNTSSLSDPLALISLIDSLFGNLTDPDNPEIRDSTCTLATILPGAPYSCTFKAQVRGVEGGVVIDWATAEAVDDEDNPVQATDDAEVFLGPPIVGTGMAPGVIAAGLAGVGVLLTGMGVLLRRRAA